MTLEKNCQRRYFNPLPPHGGRRSKEGSNDAQCYFNPLSPHGGRPAAASYLPPHEGISIHSLRMEGDRYAVCGNVAAANFNPLPPHGGRLSPDVLYPETLGFQSTPSAWRETDFVGTDCSDNIISIHSLRMEGDRNGCATIPLNQISIHSLRMEGDSGIFSRLC